MGDTVDAYTDLWHACAGPLVTVPREGEIVFYFPQGHIEQVEASTNQAFDPNIVAYNLPWKILCKVINVRLMTDPETDEVTALVALFPLMEQDENTLGEPLPSPPPRPCPNYFFKKLTDSDTNFHGGLSVPIKNAEEYLPPLQGPTQELVTKDLHGREWRFGHVFRGTPKRHVLQRCWSVFVSCKRIVAGDAFIFLRGENGELRVGVRRSMRQQSNVPSAVISDQSMHVGVVALASYAISSGTIFTVNYKPRTSPSEFIVPFDKYMEAAKNNHSIGMSFEMRFEGEEAKEQRFKGIIVGNGDVDSDKWSGSKWKCLKVRWDEVTSSIPRPERVSPWEIEPALAPAACNPLPMPRRKRPRANNSPALIREVAIGASQGDTYPRVLQGQEMTTLQIPFVDNNELDTSRKRRLGSENCEPALDPNEMTCADVSTFRAPGDAHGISSSFLGHDEASFLKNPLPLTHSSPLPSMRESILELPAQAGEISYKKSGDVRCGRLTNNSRLQNLGVEQQPGNCSMPLIPSSHSEILPQVASKSEGDGNCKLPGSELEAWNEEDWIPDIFCGVKQDQQPELVQEQQDEEAKEKHSYHPELSAEEFRPDRQEVENQQEASLVPHPSAAVISEAETLAVAVIDSVPVAIVTQETSQVALALAPQPVLASTSVVRAEFQVDDSDNSNIFRSTVQRLLNDIENSGALDSIAREKMTYLEREAIKLEASLAIVREQHAKVVVEMEQLKAKELQAMRTLLAHIKSTLEESIQSSIVQKKKKRR